MRKLFLCVSFCLVYISTQSQPTPSPTPLHHYLQKGFDTAIVLSYWSSWDIKPNYNIITTLNGGINTFAYQFPFYSFNGKAVPAELAEGLHARLSLYRVTAPDTNSYFIPTPFWKNMTERQLKKTLDSLQLWTISDDKTDGYGCAEKGCAIFDAGHFDLWLITKSGMKTLSFYAPEYYETCCPGRKGREIANTFIKLISTLFH